MSVISALQNIAAFARVRVEQPGSAGPAPRPPASVAVNRSEMLEARSRLINVLVALDTLAEALDVKTRRFQLDLPDARSNPGLTLDLFERAATLASSEEINASPHSFSTQGPAWNGSSTALLTIGGEYDGSNGNDTLFFRASPGGIRGINNLQIKVEDSFGANIGNYNIRPTDPLEQQYDLGNGLFFTLGNGLLVDENVSDVELFQGLGSAVNPDNPLGGTRASSPNFQYYPAPDTLAPVVDGAFEINGVAISVSTTDSIATVLDRINTSAAGVTAVFNPATERIEFTQNTVGASPTIDIRNDTSNFVTSAKLDSAVVVPGVDSDVNRALSDVS